MHTLVDFAQDFLGDAVLSFSEFCRQFVDPLVEADGVHVGHFGDVFPVDAEPLGLFFQPCAATNGTGDVVHERASPACNGRRSLLVVLFLDEVDDALEVDLDGRCDAERFAFHVEGLVGAVKDDVQGFVGKVLHWRVKREAVFQSDGFQLLENPATRLVVACGCEAAFTQAEVRVRDDFLLVDHCDFAQAAAFWAGAEGRVERERVGLRVFVGESCGGAHQQAAEIAQFAVVVVHHHKQPFAVTEGRLHRFLDAGEAVFVYLDAVHHDFDGVGLVAVEHHAKLDFAHLAIDADARKSRLTDMLKQLAVVTLAATDGRSEDVDALAFEAFHNQVGDLFFGVAHHFFARIVGIGLADAGVEQSQEVVYLRDGAHGGARVFVHGFLFDGNHRAKACNLVDIGALHAADELACVGRKTLHVAALSLGINRVEGQRRLAAPADARDDHQGVARNAQVDVFQVVFPRTEDFKVFVFAEFVHCWNLGRQRYAFFFGILSVGGIKISWCDFGRITTELGKVFGPFLRFLPFLQKHRIHYLSYNSIGKPSGSCKNTNRFCVYSSVLTGSCSIPNRSNVLISSSKRSTSKAKCLSPVASGWVGRGGGVGKENSSMT